MDKCDRLVILAVLSQNNCSLGFVHWVHYSLNLRDLRSKIVLLKVTLHGEACPGPQKGVDKGFS